MTTDERNTGLPLWLLSDDEPSPAELQAFYERANLPVEAIRVCENARKSMRDAYVAGLLKAHAALAQEGLFKEWCGVAGINYRTAKSIVSRAKHRQARGNAMRTRSTAVERATPRLARDAEVSAPEQVENVNRKITLVWPAEQYDRMLARLQAIGKAIGTQNYEAIVERLLDCWEEANSFTEGAAGA